MANIIDKVVSYISPEAGLKRDQARIRSKIINNSVRKYEGAAKGRRVEDWLTSTNDANTEIDGAIETLRERSRDLVRNNPWASRGVQVIESNMIGKGIMTKFDSKAVGTEKRINEIWKEWSTTTACDWAESQTYASMQRVITRSIVEAGEGLVRIHITGKADKVPLRLEVMEPDFINRWKLEATNKSNKLVSGIEIDSRGRRVAYHLFKEHPGNNITFNRSGVNQESVVVKAKFILHVHRVDRPMQIRGAPWLANTMIKLRDFDKYEDAQIVKQQMSACMTGFIIDQDGGDLKDSDIEILEKFEPGALNILGPGQDYKESSPPKVDEFGPFSNMILRAIASGLGITFESLTGDLSEVNFSSARMGWIEMNRNIETWRSQMLIPQFMAPVAQLFLDAISLKGINTKNVTFRFTPPKREMIDPTKEVPATIDAIRGGILTLPEAIRATGMDPDVVFDEIEQTNKDLDKRDIVLDSDARKTSKRGDRPREEDTESVTTE